MLIVKNTILSDDIFRKYFVCDLTQCKGICCVEGDAGAPLEEEEIGIIEDCMDEIKAFLLPESLQCIEKNGVFDYDEKGQLVTPLVHDQACAFVYFEEGIAKCAIEKAYKLHKIPFQKPISCHLYPIRITTHLHYDALNYHRWPICASACKNGEKQKQRIFEFLEAPLIRKYGREWYEEVKKEAHLYLKNT